MTDVREKLLEFHAAHTPDELRDDDAYDEFCRANEHRDEFVRADGLLAEVNGDLAAVLATTDPTPVGQVMAAVVTAAGFPRERAKLDALSEVVKRRYKSAWSKEQLEYFEQSVKKLQTWRDYFVSFTNYNPGHPDAISVVNLRHQILISTGGGLEVKHPAAVDHNLLARALDNWLSNQFEGFFWERHQEPSAVVTERLTKEVSQAFVFIQILQNTLFRREPKVNFCHLEYEVANTDPSRVLVVWAEPTDGLIKLGGIRFPEFEAWYKGLIERTRIELAPVKTPDAALDELERIIGVVRAQLHDAHSRLASQVPA